MSITCKNCSQAFEGHYCNNCGQAADTHKMNFHFLWHDIQHGLFHFDSGILYTAKQLFIRPGRSIRDFIEGRRVRYSKPFSLVVILATVYGILYHNFHLNAAFEVSISGDSKGNFNIEKFNEWITTHFSWATLFTLPFYALGSFVAFKKQGYNFVEHLVLNAFLAGQRLLLHIAAFPLVYFFNDTPAFKVIRTVLGLLDFLLLGWGYTQFFNKLTTVRSLLLTLLSFIIFGLSVLAFSLLISVVASILLDNSKH